MGRQKIPDAFRRHIAFGQHYLCKICCNILPPNWHCDHIKPLSEGGTNDTENLQILCPSCHLSKTWAEQVGFNVRRDELVRTPTWTSRKRQRKPHGDIYPVVCLASRKPDPLGNGFLYLVRWEGHDELTWEPAANVTPDLIEDFNRQNLPRKCARKSG